MGRDIFMMVVLMIGVIGVCFGQAPQDTSSTAGGQLSDDGMTGLITVLFTLFLASTVNERIIEFVKLQVPNLYLKSMDQEAELKRHKRVWWVAFGTGVFTSMFMEIDFEFLTSSGVLKIKTLSNIFEFSKPTDETPMRIGGFFLSSLFLSLGSKFWHDILDIVLFAKNAKRKLSEFDPNSVRNIGQIDQFVAADDYEMALRSLEGHRKELEENYKNSTFTVAYDNVGSKFKLCIFVLRRDKEQSQKVITNIQYTTNYGYVYTFPIIEIFAGKVHTLGDSDQDVKAGGVLYNVNNKSNKGTFGCLVKSKRDNKENRLILTCYHCVKTKDQKWDGLDFGKVDTKVEYLSNLVDQTSVPAGEIFWAYRDELMDIALIKPENDAFIYDMYKSAFISIPEGFRRVKINDGKDRTRIWFSGITNSNTTGYIIQNSISVEIKYADSNKLHTLHDLILFSKTKSSPYVAPCGPGDSGAILMEAETYRALGMVVAADDKFGYAIPMHDILKKHKLTLPNNKSFY
ncbi:MAG: hypothetical protein IPJ51_11725 [Saprospiraceae bacterium]|nr:hypothetical protein [Saprospiraceae bacterium]